MLAIFLDIETTGLDPCLHSPIDLAFKVLDLETGEILGTYQSLVKQPREVWEKSDPVSMEINGYQWEQIQTGKESLQIKGEVIGLLKGIGVERGKAVFICQNPAFDRSFFTKIIPVYTQEELQWPYHWLDLASMYWSSFLERLRQAGQPIPSEFSLSKNAIAKQYDIPPEQKPHKALNGVEHLIECYRAVTRADW
jgi:oligoribonuclease